MTKFYYNNTLLRTSDHNYTHAVINETEKGIHVFACSSSKELAQKALNAEISRKQRKVADARNCLKAIENGQTKVAEKVGRSTYWVNVKPSDKEYYQTRLEYALVEVKAFMNYKVVELESR